MADPAQKQLNADGTYGPKLPQAANKNKAPLRAVQGGAGSRPTQSQQFNQGYGQQGLQPSVGGVTPIRNVQTEKTYDPTARKGGVTNRNAVQMSTESAPLSNTQTDGIRSVSTEQHQNLNQQIARTNKTFKLTRKRVHGRKKITAAGVAGRTLQRSVTLGIWAWGFWVWLWFQLPLTILSIVSLALAQAIYDFVQELNPALNSDGLVAKVGGKLLEVAMEFGLWLAKVVFDMFSIDINLFNPSNFFVITHVLVLLTGWGILLAIGIIYTMTGQKVFSGRGASGKNAMFLLALVGYSIPVLNLFPWFFLWTLLVLKNPR